MKHIFLINPAQERRAMPRALSVPRLRTIAAKRVSTMRSMSQNVRATPRTTAGNTQNPAKRSASMPAADDKLVICGGDGTLYEVVNGAYGYPNCESQLSRWARATILSACSAQRSSSAMSRLRSRVSPSSLMLSSAATR